MNTLLQNLQNRTEREIELAEERVANELKNFEQRWKQQLLGAHALSDRDMKEVVAQMRLALDGLKTETLVQAAEVQETMQEMQKQHRFWRMKGEWRFIVTPMGLGAAMCLMGAVIAFSLAPRLVETRVEIQPPKNGLERSMRVIALGGAGTVLVLPEEVREAECPLRVPQGRICVRTPRERN